MFKRFYLIVKKYFGFKADSKKRLLELFVTSLFARVSLLTLPFIASKIVSLVTDKNYKYAFIYVFVFGICSYIATFLHSLNYNAYKKHAIYTHNNLQDMIVNKVTTYDEDFSKNISKSFIINTAFQDVGNVMQIPDILFDSINYLINIVISMIILLKVNWIVGIIMLIVVSFAFIYTAYNLKYREYYLSGQRKYQDKISSLLGEVLDGGKEIQAFNMEEDLNKYLETYKRYWRKNYFRKRRYQDRVGVISDAFIEFFKVFLYVFFAILILQGKYDIAALVLVIGYVEDVENYFWYIKEKLGSLSSMSTRVDRIYKLLNYNQRNMISFGDYDNDDIEGNIEFKNVSLTYEKEEVLKNVSFNLKPNSFTAIVGKSGSGKSTIFRALLRLYKVTKGAIFLDGINIYDYNKEVYSSNVSIVTQKPFIFEMSIRENLSLVDSNVNNQIKACKKVGVHDAIMKLPEGYNTKLIANGDNISTGEKQLLSLARTLLSKSEVLLFDEVTSSLDLQTSKQVMKILKSLKKDHTILMITHKPMLMKLADDILVIDKGRLVGRGNHKTLIKNNKYYQTLQK
ncbi:MAG: ABC transporter ATP-binding protein [Bacilli bacterium]